jgi:hypothetical protein
VLRVRIALELKRLLDFERLLDVEGVLDVERVLDFTRRFTDFDRPRDFDLRALRLAERLVVDLCLDFFMPTANSLKSSSSFFD